MRALLTLTLALTLPCLAATPAAAQADPTWPGPDHPPTDAELARARALYELGTEAADAHRWADALSSFEQSYALSGASPALFSVGYTLRVLGRFRAAREAFDQFLFRHPEAEPSIRDEAERLRREVAARVAVLSLTGLPEPPQPRVLLDAERVPDDGARPLQVEADPGHHALQVAVEGREPFVWEGSLSPGDRRTVDVVLPARSDGGADEGPSLLSHPLFWAAVGVVAVAAAVVVGIVAYEGAQLEPRTDAHITL